MACWKANKSLFALKIGSKLHMRMHKLLMQFSAPIFFIPLAHVASLPAQAVEHPNAILEPNLDSNDHPNPQPAPNPTPNPTHDPNPNQD